MSQLDADHALEALNEACAADGAAQEVSRYSIQVHLFEAVVHSNLAIAQQVQRIADHLEDHK